MVVAATMLLSSPSSGAVGTASADEDCFNPEVVGAAARGASDKRQDPNTERLADVRTVRAALLPGSVTVPTYVHVIAASKLSKAAKQKLRSRVDRQVDVLNRAFSGSTAPDAANTSLRFDGTATDFTVNETWATMGYGSREEKAAKTALRVGGSGTLNIYVADIGDGLLGWATFPQSYAAHSELDGVVIRTDSMPGGTDPIYSLGDTGTHEVGHWLGLYHTFQGGCTELNDEVADTPAQSSPTSGCPEGRDSCDLPGLDPINNYMDYSYDTCYSEFSGGQSSRMTDMWAAFRV
jgi:hypothetical protein